ncbi:hypothetical protein PVAND_006165 [Polypedilum vanderplanki]|uniref:Exosome complex component 10 homolog n=1 Tax=Polypedilum vanderplanki TaxID=319348 RepID=A0A9J6C2R5_POLVA|nr:hypothetical protein PVAND_006165 [Polypedilum vanderplanki]
MIEIKEESESSESDKNFCGFASMEDFSKNGMKLLMEATKAVNSLPSGSSRDLYSAYPSFSKVMGQHKDEILCAIQSVLQYKEIKGNLLRRDDEEKFEMIQECNDTMLETINFNLDEMLGIRKPTPAIQLQEVRASPVVPQKYQLSTLITAKFQASPQTARLISAKNILRPQAGFKVPVDNSANNPFIPRIKDKPNSLRPLAVLPEYDDDGKIVSFLHPYELEIEKFEPSDEQLVKREPQIPENMDNFPFTFVDTEEKLNEMINELRSVKEIAVDLEHHSYRTFLGITCLMQLSTRMKDYIIDTIALREELHVLNEIFTRPSILKVFHGADCDIEWLQRDLSLYVVNMFDTHQASKRLGFSRLSLAFLLKHYCNIDADKTFQLADWRMRPLPEQLLKYAQQDTHYLLYIYDMLVNDLLKLSNEQTTLLKGVYHDSKILCMKRYVKPVITENSYKDLYLKSKRSFNNQQLFALREIYAWRDKVAREEDESYPYILPNHMLLQISESLPREMQGILACCNPIPPIVRQQLNTIHQIILKAREQPVIKPIINETNIRPSVNLNSKRDLLNHPLYSPHDLSHQNEIRDDLPTLIGSVKKINESFDDIECQEIKLSVFDKSENGYKKNKAIEIKFISPYHRYKSMIPFMEEQRRKEAAMEEERRKQMLEEKKKQMPELEIVKIGDNEESVEVPLRNLKRSNANNDEFKSPHKKWKKVNNQNDDKLKATLSNGSVTSSSSSEQNDATQQHEIEEKLKEVESIVDKMKKNNKKHNKKGKPQKASDFRQNSNKPVPFDYSKVDYNRFQGGSSSSSTNSNNSKFQNKSKGGKKSKGGGAGNLNKMHSEQFDAIILLLNTQRNIICSKMSSGQLLSKVLIFLTFFGSCIIIGLLLSALVTTCWIESDVAYKTSSEGSDKHNKYGNVNFGLFSYEKSLNHGYGERNEKNINVVEIIKRDDEVLGNYYLWLFTAMGTGFSLFASSVAAVGSIVGTIKEKGGMTLIITSNVVSGIGQMVAFICWILQFVYHLQDNVLLAVDQEKWSSAGRSTFGYSFYFIISAFIVILINIFLLISARKAQNRYRKSLEGPIEEKEGNSIMLY